MIKKAVRSIIPRGLRNWLRSPLRSFHWVVDWFGGVMGTVHSLEPVPDWCLKCHPAFARFLRGHQLSDPVQSQELKQFISRCHPKMVLVDCGAHYGLFSLAAAHFGGEGAFSLAVEPSPMAANMIRAQARLNMLEKQVEVLRKSVSAHSGYIDMISAGVNSGGYLLGMTSERDSTEFSRVPSVTVDEVCLSRHLVPTHLKIDVEGMEEAVIRGAHRTLSLTPGPVVFLELHCNLIRMAGGDPAQSLHLLSSHGYAFRDVNGLLIGVDEALALPLVRLLAEKAYQ